MLKLVLKIIAGSKLIFTLYFARAKIVILEVKYQLDVCTATGSDWRI